MSNNNKLSRNNKEANISNKKRIIKFSILGVLLIVLIAVGIYIIQALLMPGSLFEHSTVSKEPILDPIGGDLDDVDTDITPVASRPHIVNVLLLGIDQDYKPYASNGGDYHTDSIIVLAINFDENKVDMISLPRDTFTHVPGINGIYKLNAAINCGGGKTEDGFNKVCEAASWMLGGISIDYYYAFELDTVIEIGDIIGGVDFDVDMSYRGSSGTYYKKGKQHLDGTGIYDYMRARKNATRRYSDNGRMDRGKAMLKAIFSKLKEQNMLTQMPAIISTFSEGLYTNTTLQQSLALANMAYNNINSEDIGSHTMAGKIRSALSWDFYFIDQAARVELIKKIYGIDVPQQQFVSYEYANWLGDYGFKTTRYLATASELLQYIQSSGTDTLNPDGLSSYTALENAYKKAQAAYDTAALTLDSDDNNALIKGRDALRECTEALADLIDYPKKLSWSVKSAWYEDTCINEVDVDFK